MVSKEDKMKKKKDIEYLKKIKVILEIYKNNTDLKHTLHQISEYADSISRHNKDPVKYHIRSRYTMIKVHNGVNEINQQTLFLETFSYLKCILEDITILSQISEDEFNTLAGDISNLKTNIESIIEKENNLENEIFSEISLFSQPKIVAFTKMYFPFAISNTIMSVLTGLNDKDGIGDIASRYVIAQRFIKIGETLKEYSTYILNKDGKSKNNDPLFQGFRNLSSIRDHLVHDMTFARSRIEDCCAEINICIHLIKGHLREIMPSISLDGYRYPINHDYKDRIQFETDTKKLEEYLKIKRKAKPEHEKQRLLEGIKEEIKYFIETQGDEQLSNEWKTLIEGYIIIRVMEYVNKISKVKGSKDLKSVGFIEAIRYVRNLRNKKHAHGTCLLDCNMQPSKVLYTMDFYVDAFLTLHNEKRYSPPIEQLAQVGAANAILGHYPEAISSFQKAIQMFDDGVQPFNNDIYYGLLLCLADMYILSYQYSEARDIYKTCLESLDHSEMVLPGVGNVLLNIAFCWEKLGDYPSAVEACQQAVNISNGSLESQQNLAMTLYRSGNRHGAIELLDNICQHYNETTGDCVAQFALLASLVTILLDDWESSGRIDDVTRAIGEMELLFADNSDTFKEHYGNQYWTMALLIIDQKIIAMAKTDFTNVIGDTFDSLKRQFKNLINDFPLEDVNSEDVARTYFTFSEAYSRMHILAANTAPIEQPAKDYLKKAQKNFVRGTKIINDQLEQSHSIMEKQVTTRLLLRDAEDAVSDKQ